MSSPGNEHEVSKTTEHSGAAKRSVVGFGFIGAFAGVGIGLIFGGVGGAVLGAVVVGVGAAAKTHQYNKNAAVREGLFNKLISDAQYEDAFKEWWVEKFPKEPYNRESFVSSTKEYVDSGKISLKNNELKFRGRGAGLVGKLYQMKKTDPV